MEQENGVAVVDEQHYPLTANAVVARVRLIQEVMGKVMKENTHYGIIPGCAKPSLWKPGAEQLLVTFRIAPDEPRVEDLSTPDCIRYRVTRVGRSNGNVVAAGIGECSSDEDKYKWRSPVCEAEYEATPEDRRRLKFKRDGTSFKQIRTNPADVGNTILKMADKRAVIAMTLLATAASDIFTQDLEDLPPEIAQGLEPKEPAKAPIEPPKEKKSAPVACDGQDTFIPETVSKKPGSKGDKTWIKFGIKSPSGEWFGSFDENFGALAEDAAKAKTKITVYWKVNGQYKDVVRAVAA